MTKKIIQTTILLLFLISTLTTIALSGEVKLITFPCGKVKWLDKGEKIEEPSGIAYHPTRKTLFVVGDEGDIYEIDENAKILKHKNLPHGRNEEIDPEGITVNTRTGNLYVAAEEGDDILEIDPETFDIVGYYNITSRRELFKAGGDGLEGIAFVPGKDPEDDRVYVCNQYDPPIVMKVALPAKPRGNAVEKHPVPVIGSFNMPVSDLSGITYHNKRKTLFVLSDENNLLMEVTTEGKIKNQWAVTGKDQEGIAFCRTFMYIAQDSGKILRIKLNKEFYE